MLFFENQNHHEFETLIQDLETHVKNYHFDEAIEVLENLDGQLKVMEPGITELSL